MYKLLKINNVTFPDPEGNYSISRTDKYNEYSGEDGKITIEMIREGIISVDVSYKGLTVEDFQECINALSLVSTVVFFDPKIRQTKSITAKITDVKYKKVNFRFGVSVWDLSFKVTEL